MFTTKQKLPIPQTTIFNNALQVFGKKATKSVELSVTDGFKTPSHNAQMRLQSTQQYHHLPNI